MSENIEQLWYTWSATGLTNYTAGFRVRAASAGLLNNIQSQYFQNVVQSNLDYALPQGTKQLHTVPLNEAPVCLSLIENGNERLLVRKQYIGRDGEGRPGNYFTHFLSGLPSSYSARDAIDLWADTSVWATSEQSLGPKDKQLPHMPYSSLLVHQATCEQTFERPAWLDLAGIQAYLPLLIHEYVLHYLHEGKSIQRFYLGSSSSARIASLIWGLAHSLPADRLASLTFSTYESDVRKSDGVIVGICWIPSQGNNNAAGIPEYCYVENTRAFNCDTPQPALPVNEELMKYAQYATRCITTNRLKELYQLLQKAEKKKQTEPQLFLNFYRQEIDKKPRPKTQCAMTMDLKRETDWDELQEESFWRDVLYWIVQDPDSPWWEQEIKGKIARLLTWAKQMTEGKKTVEARVLESGVATLASLDTEKLEETIQKRTWGQFLLLLDVLATTAPFSTDTLYWLKLFTQLQEQGVLADANWTPFRRVLAVLQTYPVPAPTTPFWTALLSLLTVYKQSLVQPLTYQDKKGHSQIWIPFASLMKNLAKVASPASHAGVWVFLLTVLTEDQQSLQRQEWMLFEVLLQVIKTTTPPAPESRFWSALLSLMEKHKAALLERIVVQERGQTRFGEAPFVSLLETLADSIAPSSHDAIWSQLLRLLADDPQAMQKSSWKPFACIVKVLKNQTAHPVTTSPFWPALLQLLTVNKEEIRRNHWKPLLDLLDALALPAPPAPSDPLWIGLLPLLDVHAEEIKQHDWPLYELLMGRWGRIRVLETSESIRTLWLSVPPPKLTDLLALPIPPGWYTEAITSYIGALRTDPSPRSNMVTIVTRHQQKFTEVLCSLVLYPDWGPIVVEFFTLLVRARYQDAFPLLMELLRPRENNAILPPSIADQLVRAAQLTPTQVIQLFGNNWQTVVIFYGWLPAIVTLLRQYLTTLEIEDLKYKHTKTVLQHIAGQAKPAAVSQEEWDPVQRLARSWNNIGAFMDNVEHRVKVAMLKTVSESIETILRQCDDADRSVRQERIANALIPLLVAAATTEGELERVLDHLGPVLGGPRGSKEDEKLAIRLLLSMAKQVGAAAKHERTLARLVLYVKVTLGRVRDVYGANAQRGEEVITTCFNSLYLDLRDTTVVKFLNTSSQSWSEKTRQEWEDYIRRHPFPQEPNEQPFSMTSSTTYSGSNGPSYGTVNGPSPLLLPEQGSMRAEPQAQPFSTQPKQYALPVGTVQPTAPDRNSFGKWIRPTRLWTIEAGAAVGLLGGIVLGALFFVKLTGVLILALIGVVFGALLMLFIDKVVPFLKERKHTAGKAGEGTPADVVAKVNGKAIRQDFFQKVCGLKPQYMKQRYEYLAGQVQSLEQQQPRTPQLVATIRFRNAEMENLSTQLNVLQLPNALKQTVLEELVEDILIQQGLAEAVKRRELDRMDLEQKTKGDIERFQRYEGGNYWTLLSQNNLTQEDVLEVLRIFVRRNQFAWHLFETDPTSSIETWLEQRKKSKKTKIERNLPGPQKVERTGWPVSR